MLPCRRGSQVKEPNLEGGLVGATRSRQGLGSPRMYPSPPFKTSANDTASLAIAFGQGVGKGSPLFTAKVVRFPFLRLLHLMLVSSPLLPAHWLERVHDRPHSPELWVFKNFARSPGTSRMLWLLVSVLLQVAAFVYPLVLHLSMMRRGPSKPLQKDGVFGTLVSGKTPTTIFVTSTTTTMPTTQEEPVGRNAPPRLSSGRLLFSMTLIVVVNTGGYATACCNKANKKSASWMDKHEHHLLIVSNA